MLPTEEARLRRWPRHNCAPSGCAPTHAICWRSRNPHRPRPTKQRPSSPRFPPCEAFERRPPAARPTVVQGADVRNPSAKRKFHPSVISCVPNPLAATDETVSPTAPISCVVQSTKYSCEVGFFCLPDLPSQKIVMLPLQFLGESRGSVAVRVSVEIES